MNDQTASTTQSQHLVPRVAEADSRFSRNFPGLLAGLGFAALACVVSPAWAQNVSLGTAANFGVLAGSAVTNTGPTVVTGNVGVWPGTAISGFPPGSIVSGFQHSADTVAQQAQADLTTAYNDAAGRPSCTAIAGGLLGAGGATTLGPGVYCMGAGSLTGTLTLNGAGVYIFQMASSLTTASGSSIALTNGASACGVWWQVTSSATIGTTSAMAGNILALTSITLNTNATLDGRALARNALVSLASNTVTACSGGPVPAVPPPAAIPPIAATPPGNIPTLSEWALVMLAALLAIGGFAAMRRKAR
jgi:Ice-binding-like/IPTL-CTERM motif